MALWNPWRYLRERDDRLKLKYRAMHPSRGLIFENPDGTRTITLNSSLGRRERNEVLGHECVHDQLDLVWPCDAPEALRQKGEHLVSRIADEKLLPVTVLQEWVDRRGGVIHRWEVAEEFDVTEELAERQMRRCAWGF